MAVITSTSYQPEVRVRTSIVYEVMASLRSLHISKQRNDRINSADLGFFYGNFDYGAQFAELAIDYSEHYSFERFIQYVREMNVSRFLYYVLGRYLSESELHEYFSASGWHPENILTGLKSDGVNFGPEYGVLLGDPSDYQR